MKGLNKKLWKACGSCRGIATWGSTVSGLNLHDPREVFRNARKGAQRTMEMLQTTEQKRENDGRLS